MRRPTRGVSALERVEALLANPALYELADLVPGVHGASVDPAARHLGDPGNTPIDRDSHPRSIRA